MLILLDIPSNITFEVSLVHLLFGGSISYNYVSSSVDKDNSHVDQLSYNTVGKSSHVQWMKAESHHSDKHEV